MNNPGRSPSDTSSSLSQQPGQYKYVRTLPRPCSTLNPSRQCSHRPSRAIQPSLCPLPQFRTRSMSSQSLFLHPESRISLAMHVGASLVLLTPHTPHTFITHRLIAPTRTQQAEKSKMSSAARSAKGASPPSQLLFGTLTISITSSPVSSMLLLSLPLAYMLTTLITQHCIVKNYPCTSVLPAFSPSSPSQRPRA
jgi:hypothetical protein